MLFAIRTYLRKQTFLEVETPILVPAVIPESYLDMFQTTLRSRQGKNRQLFLTPSPEVSLKKLLAAGVGNCFEITRAFRNGETGSNLHNPEFTILEWYRVGATYEHIMDDCEDMVRFLHTSLFPKAAKHLVYQEQTIDLTSPWERLSVDGAMKKYANVSLSDLAERDKGGKSIYPTKTIAAIAKKKGYAVSAKSTWEELFNQIFLNEVEPHMGTHGRPTILYDYPIPLAALAKIKESDPSVAERFEFYIGGLELGDCYTELTQWQEQQQRFASELALMKEKKRTPVIADDDFITALKMGLPDCAGIAVGLDRLSMLFANTRTLSDVMLFPLAEIDHV